MRGTPARTLPAAIALALVAAHLAGAAHAQSSLGIGTSEATIPSTGLFGGLMMWVNQHQQAFYRSLTGALKAMREDGGKLWLLIGLSFAYGVFHAAGPGHGKAVISSYMLANEVALRRGVMLSFVSAFLQAGSALAMMALVFLVLRGTSVSMTGATWFLEIASYALVTLFGAWLLWRKAAPRLTGLLGKKPAHSLSAAFATAEVGTAPARPTSSGRYVASASPAAAAGYAAPARRGGWIHSGPHHANCGHEAAAFGQGAMVCETCGHGHLPDPAMLSDDRFDWRTAWSAVAAVGLRPCSGALIVLTFAFLNGLWLGGVLSVLAMSAGTAITVSALAILAVTAKNWAVGIAGDGRAGNRIHALIEIGGAAMVFLLGLALLSASLAA